ncbi:MAG: OmpH family outer membrane protein [Edaphocola sp.]
MKKILFLLTLGFAVGYGYDADAQKKTGYVNAQELLETMPEARKADSSVTKYTNDLQEQMKLMVDDYQKKVKDFDDKGATWSDAVKEVKTKEIQDLQGRLQDFQQSAEEKIAKKRQELFKPILEKAQKAIKAVGTEGAYDYIFDGGSLLYAKDSENIMPAVKAKLGIK